MAQSEEEQLALLNELAARVTELDRHVTTVLSHPQAGNSVERATAQASLAYALHSVFFIYLKLRGRDVSSHPVRAELERVKKAMQLIRATEVKLSAKTAEDQPSQ